jgi:hypothetical protein
MKSRIYLTLAAIVAFACANAQNVGIGTSAPTGKLHVLNGTMNQTAVLVNQPQTGGDGIGVYMGGSTDWDGVYVSQPGIGHGILVNHTNTLGSTGTPGQGNGIRVTYEGHDDAVSITSNNTSQGGLYGGLFVYNKGQDQAIWGGAAGPNGSCVVGTNYGNGLTAIDEGTNSSGVQGCSFTNKAVSGYVIKTTATALNSTQAGYFAQLTGTSAPYTTVNSAFVAYRTAAGTNRKIDGAGTVGTIILDADNVPRLMNSIEAPEILFTDYGVGKLSNGRARITIDPVLSKNIIVDDKNPLKVLLTMEGETNGVYITNKSASGFEVIELNRGKSNASFSYQIIANRADDYYEGILISKNDSSTRLQRGPEIYQKMNVKEKSVPSEQSDKRIKNDNQN